MNNSNYNMKKLAASREFNAEQAERNFNGRQEYFEELTDFLENSPDYLRSYNPTVVVYGDSARQEFLTELAEIKYTLSSLCMTTAVDELDALSDAIAAGNVKELSDGLLRFRARMSIISEQVISAQIIVSEPPGAAEAARMFMELEAKPTVFVVDDNRRLLKSVNDMIGDTYKVVCHASAAETLKAMESQSPEMFIIDVNMPGMNGYELASRIRQNFRFGNTPIVFMNGNSEEERIITAKALGGNDYIYKPINSVTLLKKIKDYLSKPQK